MAAIVLASNILVQHPFTPFGLEDVLNARVVSWPNTLYMCCPTGDGAATTDSPGTADAIDPARLLTAVRRAARTADVVVVYPHWGVQGERCPGQTGRREPRALAHT
mgnify:CR=1 FL=1